MNQKIVQRRFLTDAMLGGLTRWLRVLGLDTIYNPAEDDRDLVRLADAEQRVLLTRDRHLVEHLRPAEPVLIQADKPLVQLRQVVDACDLSPPIELFTRCLVCNETLTTVASDHALAQVPPEAHKAPGPIRQCPCCQRVYWAGSHTRRMSEALTGALPEWFGASP
jgi:uncharacterized protein with PIN domain